MNKNCAIGCGVALLIGLLVASVGGYFAFKGLAANKEGSDYADVAIKDIFGSWSLGELEKRASPEFKAAAPSEKLEEFLKTFKGELGDFKSAEPSSGSINANYDAATGSVVTGEYSTKATFEKGQANLKLKLIKHNGAWEILHLDLDKVGGGSAPAAAAPEEKKD